MNCQKGCGMGKICWSFWFAQYSVVFNLTTSEKVPICLHLLQLEHHQIDSLRSFGFQHRKDSGKDAPSTKIKYYQNIGQLDQGKGEGKKEGEIGRHLLKNYSTRSMS